MNLLEGKLLAEGQRIGVVAARFNEFITAKLVGGAKDAFVRHGGDENKLDLAWVPGAFEIPLGKSSGMARSYTKRQTAPILRFFTLLFTCSIISDVLADSSISMSASREILMQ